MTTTETLPRWAIAQLAMRYDASQLFDLVLDPKTSPEAVEIYKAKIYQRADAIVAESEGRIPHPNQGVHNMLRKKFKGDRPGPTAPVVNDGKHSTGPGR